MAKPGSIALIAIAMFSAVAVPAFARHGGFHGGSHHGGFHHGFHHRVIIGVGPGWWGPPFYALYPYSYVYGVYPPYDYYGNPFALFEEPQVFIQQPPATAAASPAPGFWYYCPSAGSYYPNVARCAEAWVQVAPRPPGVTR